MGRFSDALAALTGLEDVQSFPPDWATGLSSAYDDDMAEVSGPLDSANAMVGQLQTENAALAAEVQAVKAHNYELMMQVGSPDESSEDSEDNNDSDSDDSEDNRDDAQRAIDDLFE